MYKRIRTSPCLCHRHRQMSLGSDLYLTMGNTQTNFTSLVWMLCMSVFSYFCYFMICTMIFWSLSLHHHLSKITSFLSNGQFGADSILWRRFKTILQLLNNKLSKNIFTNHEILTLPSFSTQFHSIQKWYQYLCF